MTNAKMAEYLFRLAEAQEAASERKYHDYEAEELFKLSRQHLRLAIQIRSNPDLYPPDAPASRG